MGAARRHGGRSVLGQYIAALAVLAAALWLLLAQVVFVVRDVQVEGAGEVPVADVQRLSGIHPGMRMRAVDARKVQTDVESDGRVAFVSLEKRYPSRILLTVRPRTLDALILLGGKILILDSDAYVVRIADQLPEVHVPYVSGIRATYYTPGRQLDTSDGRCLAMKAVLEALKRSGATGYARELDVSNTEDLRIVARNGTTVLLGSQEGMEDKIIWMAGALSDLEARGETGGELDVSSGTKADYRPAAVPEPEAGDEAEAPDDLLSQEAAEDSPEAQDGQWDF
ncbi:MAG: FtsQ-type POTRA domain-containing protein [Clostridia bacterium]|nr:FtsQ-type POTRA domain-containing protein [Clostridia bacterium]